jgi:hypothetical protein
MLLPSLIRHHRQIRTWSHSLHRSEGGRGRKGAPPWIQAKEGAPSWIHVEEGSAVVDPCRGGERRRGFMMKKGAPPCIQADKGSTAMYPADAALDPAVKEGAPL